MHLMLVVLAALGNIRPWNCIILHFEIEIYPNKLLY